LNISSFRLTFVFLLAPLATLEYFWLWLGTLKPPAMYQLIFAPFSPTEDLNSGVFSIDKFLLNYVAVLIAIALAEAYFRFLWARRSSDLRSERLLLDATFVLGVVVSYILSILALKFTSTPSSGTSIIALCVGLVAFGVTVREFVVGAIRAYRTHKGKIGRKEYTAFAGATLAAVFLSPYAGENWAQHLAGALLFVPLLGLYNSLTGWRRSSARREKVLTFVWVIWFGAVLLVFPYLASMFQVAKV